MLAEQIPYIHHIISIQTRFKMPGRRYADAVAAAAESSAVRGDHTNAAGMAGDGVIHGGAVGGVGQLLQRVSGADGVQYAFVMPLDAGKPFALTVERHLFNKSYR